MIDQIVCVERLDRHRLSVRWVEPPSVGVFEVHEGQIKLWRDHLDGPTILDVWTRRDRPPAPVSHDGGLPGIDVRPLLAGPVDWRREG
ncbi:MAG: hypothetical protein KGS00_09900 [Alphaproteobacteria bacterium]|nr:hypothetical protein [Alphaproteobacteria bacterium]